MAKKKEGKKKASCYISGKISGLGSVEVIGKFARAEKAVEQLGFEPVNPMKNGVEGDEWGKHMVEDIKNLEKCEAVFFLDDWEFSEGAKIEHTLAKNMKKKIFYQIEDLPF